MSKRFGWVIGCKDKTSSLHLNGFPDGSNIGSTMLKQALQQECGIIGAGSYPGKSLYWCFAVSIKQYCIVCFCLVAWGLEGPRHYHCSRARVPIRVE